MLKLTITGMRARGLCVAAALATAVACGQTESTPTSATTLPSRSGGSTVQPAPAPATPAPTAPSTSATGKVEVTITPNPVPFSGQPITDIASCRDRPNTWFYDQVLREVGGAAVTITERVDTFDGAVASRTSPSLRIAAKGSTTIRTRWCSSSAAAHTAQTTFRGTDANGRTWSVTGPTVRLLAK
jgi:hypothetical protein